MSQTVTLPGYESESRAAELLGYSLWHLQALRRRGMGPAYIRRGKSAVYKVDDLKDWLDKGRVDPKAS